MLTAVSTTLLCLLSFCSLCQAAEKLRFEILQSSPHDNQVFTQGLVVDGDNLIESSGHYGQSFVRVYESKTGKVIRQQALPAKIFAEGITLFEHNLYLLSWRESEAFVLDPISLKTKKIFRYQGEGWGITHNGESLFTSDGSHIITEREPSDFSATRRIPVVHAKQGKIDRINELEYAKEHIWANRWKTNFIYAINPNTGEVKGELDLSELVPALYLNSQKHVLNGIAYAPALDAFWVTGKNWPIRYLIKVSL
ncbi:Glutamine cyclotransferase [Alteromonadaceae bacterium Bs31]|nr:Glutamine cyclotransferase [Alteromonadaceae bacterium Bs31]